jgi:tetratricopeptide (TPR) repeat protein
MDPVFAPRYSGGAMSDPVQVQGLIEVQQTEIALLLEAGYLYMEMQKWKEAEEIFSGVAALVPHSDVPLISLGNLAFGQGQYQRALKFHKDAVKKVPDSALAHAHQGEALLFLNKRDEAKKMLEQAIELDPKGAAADFARSLLDGLAAGVV